MATEQTKKAAERISGVPNVTYDLTAVFHNKLEGIAAMETYRQDAEAAGDREAAAFFADCQKTARSEAEHLRGLLAQRLQSGQFWQSDAARRETMAH